MVAERGRLAVRLESLGFGVLPSASNFLLVKPPQGSTDARSLYRWLKMRNILVRWFDLPRLRDMLRITVGTPQQDDTLLAAIEACLRAADGSQS